MEVGGDEKRDKVRGSVEEDDDVEGCEWLRRIGFTGY